MGTTIKYKLEDFDKGQIINKFEMEKGGKVDLFLANDCYRRMVKYTPWDTGNLATTVTVRPGSITYEQEYAHKQYTTNKGKGIRGKYWDQKMYNNEKEIIVQEVSDYISKIGRK